MRRRLRQTDAKKGPRLADIPGDGYKILECFMVSWRPPEDDSDRERYEWGPWPDWESYLQAWAQVEEEFRERYAALLARRGQPFAWKASEIARLYGLDELKRLSAWGWVSPYPAGHGWQDVVDEGDDSDD